MLRLGNIVPDFACDTTQGPWDSFHQWKKGKWAVLFSHPADFTPVCTTEIGSLAQKYKTLKAMDCQIATLSVDPVESHHKWLKDVIASTEEENITIEFPIIADSKRDISAAYGMIDPWTSDKQELPLTIRCVYFIFTIPYRRKLDDTIAAMLFFLCGFSHSVIDGSHPLSEY